MGKCSVLMGLQTATCTSLLALHVPGKQESPPSFMGFMEAGPGPEMSFVHCAPAVTLHLPVAACAGWGREDFFCVPA